jgi:hypothetical protein
VNLEGAFGHGKSGSTSDNQGRAGPFAFGKADENNIVIAQITHPMGEFPSDKNPVRYNILIRINPQQLRFQDILPRVPRRWIASSLSCQAGYIQKNSRCI